VAHDTLETGRGYWLKFSSAQNIVIDGAELTSDTVDVSEGWNIVGSLSSPIEASSITSIPPGIVTSGFFQYEGSYQQSTIILPGKGYWVKCSQSGLLILSTADIPPSAGRIRIMEGREIPPEKPE